MRTNFVDNRVKAERKLEVRIAENQLEIERTLALRYEVFNLELGEGLPQSAATRKDRDEYDLFCDHLIVIDKNRENKIVGTYRILRRSVAKQNLGFYSDNEFDITKIYEFDAETAEIGRSCVHPEYRDGSVISMLWAG
ncbi:GNAT family N-acetyltransferase, partial [Leptospira borgpetersenii serovar Tarassovi]